MQKQERHWRHAMCLSFRWNYPMNHSVLKSLTHSAQARAGEREEKKRRQMKRWKLIPTTMYCVCSTCFRWQQETVKTIISIFNESLSTSVQESAYAHHILHSQSAFVLSCSQIRTMSSSLSSSSSSSSRSFWTGVYLLSFSYTFASVPVPSASNCATSNEKLHICKIRFYAFLPKLHRNCILC